MATHLLAVAGVRGGQIKFVVGRIFKSPVHAFLENKRVMNLIKHDQLERRPTNYEFITKGIFKV